MPALVKSGPKLPSFQKLKKRKRSDTEDVSKLPEAPATKKQTKGPTSESGPTHTSAAPEQPKERVNKIKKAFEWKKKMAAEKEERLKKATQAKAQEQVKPVEVVKPGQNWQKLKSTMTHVRKPVEQTNSTSNPESIHQASSSNAGEGEANGEAEKKSKATSPAGWNPKNLDVTCIVGLDCEMVGVGEDGKKDSLARVVVVNYYGGVLLDVTVRQEELVVDTREHVSGIKKKNLKKGEAFKKVQEDVYKLLKDKIVVGHGLTSDFKALMLDHPKLYTRDTARYRPLQRVPGKPHALKELGAEVLGVTIQEGKHNPVQDAQTALLVYRHVQKNWEASIKTAVKTPSTINPITKLVEKATREALNAASKPVQTEKKKKAPAPKKKPSEIDSWASSESESEESDSDNDSDSSSAGSSSDSSGSGESSSEDSDSE